MSVLLRMCLLFIFVLLNGFDRSECGGPPQFEQNLQYSKSYLPAAMQIIAYLTEGMKYELRPQPAHPAPTTTTTQRPTPPHRPGLFQPSAPAPHHRNVKALSSRTLGAIIRQHEPFLPGGIHEQDLELLGIGPKNLHRANDQTVDLDVNDFLSIYDDDAATNSNLLLDRNDDVNALKQKKQPPTRAYVTLLSLYDLLNKETKRLGLNRFAGYADHVLRDLVKVSTGTSAYQLDYVLRQVQGQKETRDPMLDSKLRALVEDLAKEDSYISIALRYIPPLPFVF